MRITRLSQGVDASQTLTPQAMERTFDVLATYRAACDGFRVTTGLLVATSAVRDASNRSTFLSRAHGLVGFEAKVLSGAEEAAFSYAGATNDVEEVAVPTMIVDVGGGSTGTRPETTRRVEELLDAARMRSGEPNEPSGEAW